jgi:predicted GTPase
MSPKVDAEEVEQLLEKVRSELPTPVFWLLGKTQSGKSSIIRAMTGSTRAEIGNGFRPCTRTAQQYPFPDEADPLIRFLDTRGLVRRLSRHGACSRPGHRSRRRSRRHRERTRHGARA